MSQAMRIRFRQLDTDVKVAAAELTTTPGDLYDLAVALWDDPLLYRLVSRGEPIKITLYKLQVTRKDYLKSA